MTGISNRKHGMILPFEPHSIAFNEIKYSVDMPQVILLQVNVKYVCIVEAF